LRSAGTLRNVQVGSITVVSSSVSADTAPLAFALFQYAADGASVSETSDFSAAGFAMNLFVESQGNFAAGAPGSMQSAIAVTNPNVTSASTYHFELYASDGTLMGTGPDFVINGHSQITMFLGEIPGLPPIPSSFQGVLRLAGGVTR